MKPYIMLPCGALIKASSISRVIPHGPDQEGDRKAPKPGVSIHHGSVKLRLLFKSQEDRDEFISDLLNQLNHPTKS